jgi:Protein of unknown function (DUF4238)
MSHHIKDPELLRSLPDLRITLTNAVSESIRQSLPGAPVLYDLKYKLIRNTSNWAFITSDAPVVLHNRMFENISDRAALGFANIGLQILLPLGPWRVMLFYDEAAYDVGVKTSNLMRLCNPQHARLINQLQWEVAHENLYLSPETDPSEVLQDAEQLAHLRHTE